MRAITGSVASDLMEPLRPIVDEVVLELLTTRELARGSAVDTQVGVCCLGAELARQLAASASQLRSTPVPDVALLRSRLPAGWVALRYRTRSRIDSTPCSLTPTSTARQSSCWPASRNAHVGSGTWPRRIRTAEEDHTQEVPLAPGDRLRSRGTPIMTKGVTETHSATHPLGGSPSRNRRKARRPPEALPRC